MTTIHSINTVEIGGKMAWLKGYPREKVNWGPTIDTDKCVGCGMCMNCGKAVYDWEESKAVVGRYNDCVVGCTTCANLCLNNAISFPDIEKVRAVYKEHNVYSHVKEDLIEKGKINI